MHSKTHSRRTINIIGGVVILALFGASNTLLIAKFLKLRSELNTAYGVIAKLQNENENENENVNSMASAELYQKDAAPYEMRIYNRHTLSKTISSAVNITNTAKSIVFNRLALSDLRMRLISGRFLSDREYILFVFFSPTDCPACLQEAAQWQRLHLESQGLNLSVVGIMNHPSISEGEAYLKQLRVTFPILSDDQGFLRAHYKIVETPEKLLADSAGSILLRNRSNKTQERQIAFEQSIRRILIEHRSTP